MYKALLVANYFLYIADRDNGDVISNLKLQKLLYYAQGMHLVVYKEPLFEKEIKAWQKGPAIEDLFHFFNNSAGHDIPINENAKIDKIDKRSKEFLNVIYAFFGQFSANGLINMSQSDSCWAHTKIGNIITHKAMESSLEKYLNAISNLPQSSQTITNNRLTVKHFLFKFTIYNKDKRLTKENRYSTDLALVVAMDEDKAKEKLKAKYNSPTRSVILIRLLTIE